MRYTIVKRYIGFLSAVFLLSTGAVAQTPKTDREFAGLKGKVQSVTAQYAKLASDGKSRIGPWWHSYDERYDKEGNLLERESYDDRNNMSQKDVYSVIDGDETMKSQSFHHDLDPPAPIAPANSDQRPGDPRYSIKFKYKYHGNTVECTTYHNDGTEGTQVVSTYEGGNKIKEDFYGRDGSVSTSSVTVYGERGEELERNNSSGETVRSRYKYTDYEIDLRGNWIRRTMWLSNGVKSEFQPYESESRLISYFDGETSEAMAKSPQAADKRFFVIRVNEGALVDRAIKKVDPVLPAESRGIKGEVLIEVTVDEQGNVAAVEGISGDPVLLKASFAALRQ
ncbi:MAG TPA: hypothetical protein VJX67_07080, partial [Blastocatellia bacterium]|nr:hypothetical protein [Blastocatellia bacterium]